MNESRKSEQNGEVSRDLLEYEKYKVDSKKEAKYNEEMRDLLSRTMDLREAAERGEDVSIEEATNIVKQSDDVITKAKSSSTAYLDAQILLSSSLFYKECVERMDSHMSEFKVFEFAESIVAHMEGEHKNDGWRAPFEDTATLCLNAPGWSWQLGAIDIDEIQQGQRIQRQKRDNILDAPMKNPKKVQSVDKEEEDLEKHMQSIMGILCKWERTNKEPMSFWELVLHPTSFSETVENIFHVSHLVKEGLVYLGNDREQLPIIQTMKKGQGKKETVKFANAITINMKQWEALIDAYEVTRPTIPARGNRRSDGK